MQLRDDFDSLDLPPLRDDRHSFGHQPARSRAVSCGKTSRNQPAQPATIRLRPGTHGGAREQTGKEQCQPEGQNDRPRRWRW